MTGSLSQLAVELDEIKGAIPGAADRIVPAADDELS